MKKKLIIYDSTAAQCILAFNKAFCPQSGGKKQRMNLCWANTIKTEFSIYEAGFICNICSDSRFCSKQKGLKRMREKRIEMTLCNKTLIANCFYINFNLFTSACSHIQLHKLNLMSKLEESTKSWTDSISSRCFSYFHKLKDFNPINFDCCSLKIASKIHSESTRKNSSEARRSFWCENQN